MTEKGRAGAVEHFSGYVKQFHAYYEERPEFHERFRIWSELIDKYCDTPALSIDVGCGTGVFSFYLAKKGGRVIGIDGAPNMVSFCEAQRLEQGLENMEFVQAKLPKVDEARLSNADVVISSSVVEYVEDLDASLALLGRLLKPGGVLIVSMPNALSISRVYERLKYKLTGEPGIYRYIRHFTSPLLLERRMRRHGLVRQEARYYTHYTRLAKLTRALRLPPPLTEDLFAVVFRKLPRAA